MKNHQVRMDVIGNNISNVNTVGFKAGRVNFQDALYQVLKSGGTSTNPAQVGLGVSLASISSDMKQGGLQSTGRTLDLAINGDGFFKVKDPASGRIYYTRDGVFYVDQGGYLVNSSGYRLIGDLRNITAARASVANAFPKITELTGNDTAATVIAVKDYALITANETQNATETLTLRGTMSDGTAGKSYDLSIVTAQAATVNSGGNEYLDYNSTLNQIGLSTGDVVEFTVTNAYTGEKVAYSFEVINAYTQTIGHLKKAIEDHTNGKIKLDLTQGGKIIEDGKFDSTLKTGLYLRTADCGPGVNLKVATRDALKNPKSFVLNTGAEGISGTGDDIYTIVQKINNLSSITGVAAANENNRLKLFSLGKGEKAVVQLSGSAVPLLGLPATGTIDVAAHAMGTVENALISPYATRNASQTLTLQGTLAGGTPGMSHSFTIETAGGAVVDLGKNFTINAGGRTKLSDIYSQLSSGDKLEFTYKNSYTGNDVPVTITIEIDDPALRDLNWLKEQFEAKAKEKGIDDQVEMYFTDNGYEVGASFLDGDGDEGFGFRTKTYGPGVSLQVRTLDSNGVVKEVFNDVRSGTGDDIDTIVAKINAETAKTGVIAKKVNNKLVLETEGKGAGSVLHVSGDAAHLLGLPVSATTSTAAVVTGSEKYARITGAESNQPLTLWIQGTLADGTAGTLKPFTINPATPSEINAGDDYSISDTTTLQELGLQNGDEIIVEYVNNYTGKQGNFTITIQDNTKGLAWLQTQFDAAAKAAGLENDVKMDFTATGSNDKIVFYTTDYGPGVTLTVTTKRGGSVEGIFTGNNSELNDGTESKSGGGDDIGTIVDRINAALDTGVIAKKVDGRLVLETAGTGENAVLQVSGDAAYLLGLPVTTGNPATVLGTTQFTGTLSNNVTLTLQGTLTGGTPGTAKQIPLTAGADLNAIIKEINNYTKDTGVYAANRNGYLELTTLGTGENATLKVGGDAAEVLGLLPITYTSATNTRTPATAVGTVANPQNVTGNNITLTLQGTKADGTLGTSQDIPIASGADIDAIISTINGYTDVTGVYAAKVFDEELSGYKLVLKTLGEGENAILKVGGDAAEVLGLSPITYWGTIDYEVFYGDSEYAADLANNTEPAAVSAGTSQTTVTLTLKGTRVDGSGGDAFDFTINAARQANINAGENYTINAGTTMGSFGFKDGDTVEFTINNPYNPEQSKTISVRVFSSQTLNDFRDALYKEAGGAIEMYFTQGGLEDAYADLDGSGDEGFGFRTAAYGPGVKLTVLAKDLNGNTKRVFNGINSDFTGGIAEKTGSGDDIDTIISKINEKTSLTGVIASKDASGRLVLRTADLSEGAKLSVGGDAAQYLGLTAKLYENTGTKITDAYLKLAAPTIASLNISGDGTITGTDDQGRPLEWANLTSAGGNLDLAQIYLYTFSNQNGLKRVDKSLFERTASSGDEIKGKPGSAGYGTIESGYLEMSNVDLTDEFTNMITTQRGYQASARIITVSDTMLEELINLKR
jgi:flagellar hook-basal body protein